MDWRQRNEIPSLSGSRDANTCRRCVFEGFLDSGAGMEKENANNAVSPGFKPLKKTDTAQHRTVQSPILLILL